MENRYEKYKDSGIAWIGNIPEHWEVKKLGHLYIPRNEKVSDQDYPALSVTMQGVLLPLFTSMATFLFLRTSTKSTSSFLSLQ